MGDLWEKWVTDGITVTIQLLHPQLFTYMSVFTLPAHRSDHWYYSANPLTIFKIELLLCPSRATFQRASKYSEETTVSVVQRQSLNRQILLAIHGKTGNSIFLRTTVLMNVCYVRNSAVSVERQVFRFSPVNALPKQVSTRLTWKMTQSYGEVSITITRLGSASEFF